MNGGLTVVKLGGSLLDDQELRIKALRAIAGRWSSGSAVVIVHGGGKRINSALARVGIARKTHHGLRVTDAATLEIVVGVLAGNVNKELVSELTSLGVAASGFSGADGGTLTARLHPSLEGVDLGFVGEVISADPSLLHATMKAGLLPVVAPLGVTTKGALLNINADAAAAALAASAGADRVIFFTDVEGLFDKTGSIVRSLGISDARGLLDSPHVRGGMLPKLRACVEAVAGGVGEVVIAGPSTHLSALEHGIGGTHLVAA